MNAFFKLNKALTSLKSYLHYQKAICVQFFWFALWFVILKRRWIDPTFPRNRIRKMQCTHNRSLMQICHDWEHKRGCTRQNNRGRPPWTNESIPRVSFRHWLTFTLHHIEFNWRHLPGHSRCDASPGFILRMHRIAHRCNRKENDSALISNTASLSREHIN